MHHDINDNLDNIEKRDASITQLLQTNNDNEEGLVDTMHAMTLDIIKLAMMHVHIHQYCW